MGKIDGRAVISVNKALVTQSSSAIPFIPLYFILLSKVMNEKGIDEDCIKQIDRLFRQKLSTKTSLTTDEQGRIRLDDFELRADVQKIVMQRWEEISPVNIREFLDLEKYHKDFLKLFGFGYENVNYDEDVDVDLKIPSSQVCTNS